jgi:predicted HAD superfamily Cof-like phosphohydrolase
MTNTWSANSSEFDWVKDLNDMHAHYGFHGYMKEMDPKLLKEYLKFRIDFLQEEINEMNAAYETDDDKSAEDVVDALIDLCVVAIGTLDLYGVDAHKAWREVRKANMNKRVGIKESRPNPFGLPDLVKPEGWRGPKHGKNVGRLEEVFDKIVVPV